MICPRYELIQKGETDLRALGNVPDVYSQVMFLESENKNLKKDLKRVKQAAEYVNITFSFLVRLSKK